MVMILEVNRDYCKYESDNLAHEHKQINNS